MSFLDSLDPQNLAPIDRLKVAFACGVAKVISDADGQLDLNEIRMLMTVFSDELMSACGFIDAKGAFTPTYRKIYDEARHVLPQELDKAEKLDLLTIFHSSMMVDGEAHPKELAVLHQAGEALGLSQDDIAAHLTTL